MRVGRKAFRFWIRGSAALHGAGRQLVCRPSRAQRCRARLLPRACELLRRTIGQCAMRPDLVVVLPPALELVTDVGKVEEGFHVQALVAQTSVERLDIAIFDRSSRPNELEPYAVLIRPRFHCPTSKFAAVVYGN